jgi:nucleotide-binding universal stress UspA family protein
VALLLDFRPIDYPNICSTKIKFGRLKIKFGSAHAQPVPHCPRDASSRANAAAARDAKAHAAKILSGVADAAKAAGVPCETLQMIHDHPHQAIVATAKEKGCDLIVMASHGKGGIAAVVLGSVTTKVLTHTAIPILVCH